MGTTIIEYSQFRSRASRFLCDDELDKLLDMLSMRPKSGSEFEATGGVRQLPWPHKPKCIVGYYYADSKSPVRLVDAFRVGEKQIQAKIIRRLADG